MEPLVFAGLMFFGVLVVFVSMIIGAQLDPVQARLQQIAVRPRTLEELELQRPLSERMLKPIIDGLLGSRRPLLPAEHRARPHACG